MSTLRSVLLVDDDDDLRLIGEMALVDVGGLVVHTARSGLEALELAAQARPDVILLDVMMPGLDGPSTFARLREQPATADIPVIFMTAKARQEELDRYQALGAIGAIGKPFDPMTLAATVRRLVER
ncbi:MAG: response regulator [Sandaracinaceae bacterium]|nr:response regulator [Sandaracinaceae bacterium]